MEEEDHTERFSNIEAEQALLGSILFDNGALSLIDNGLEPRHFYEPFHQRVYAILQERIGKGEVAEPITVIDLVRDDKAFSDLGGMRYFADLVDRAPPSANCPDYAKIILNCWQLRELRYTLQQALMQRDASEAMIEVRKRLSEVDSYEDAGDGFEDLQAIASRRIEQLNKWAVEGKTPGLQTGLKCFDNLGGLMPSTEWTIGGRPGMGKTALLRSCLNGAAKMNPDYDFLFYSIEMSKEQGIDRALSAATLTTNEVMTKPEQYRGFKRPSIDMIRTLATIRGELPSNVLISGRSRVAVDDIRRGMARLQAKRKRPIGAVGIDYFQLMQFYLERGDSLSSAMSKATRDIKTISKDFGCAMILLSQLSRTVESRENKRPVLSDLKETSGLEQDADYVLFPFRPHYYEQKAGKQKGDIDDEGFAGRLKQIEHDMLVGVAKARDDSGGDIAMYCDMPFDVVRNP